MNFYEELQIAHENFSKNNNFTELGIESRTIRHLELNLLL